MRIVVTCLLAFLTARLVAAQEMTFEAEPMDEPAASPAGPAAAPGAEPLPEERPRAVVLVIRSEDAEAELAQVLTESLSRQVVAAGKVDVMPSEDFHVRLFAPGEHAAQDCATNAVCLSGYGKELWLDRIVMGVLYKGVGGYNLNVDLVGVERADVEQYSNRDLPDLPTMSAADLDKEMSGVVFKLFDLRDPSLEHKGPAKRLVARAGPVQTGMAWSSAGLAGVALITGLVFGAQARSIQSELEGDVGITQREASKKIDDGEAKALGAYMAFAASGVLLATSAALFLIKPLQEVESRPTMPGFDEEASLSPYLVPALSTGGASLTLGLRF